METEVSMLTSWNWLTKDDYIWKELIRFTLTLLASLILLGVGRLILLKRDRKIQELDRKRSLLDSLRKEFIGIFNDYYKTRKRYSTVRAAAKGRIRRNPYIKKLGEKSDEVMDSLLASCIELEAQYYSLMEMLNISFPELWAQQLKSLMQRRDKRSETREDNIESLEYYFDTIRDYIEKETIIDEEFKTSLFQKYNLTLKAFNDYEKELLELFEGVFTRYFNKVKKILTKA